MKLIISHISGFVRDYELEGGFAARYRSGQTFPAQAGRQDASFGTILEKQLTESPVDTGFIS
jgi:hypothetical protein